MMERPDDQANFPLRVSAYRPSHLLAAVSSAVGSFGAFYLIGVGNLAWWLALSILIGFVFIRGSLAMREARGAAIGVSDHDVTIPPAATWPRKAHILARDRIRSVRLIRSHLLRSPVLEIEVSTGERLRVQPTVVDTTEVAGSIERRMGIPTTFRSTWGYQPLAALIIMLILWAMIWLALRRL